MDSDTLLPLLGTLIAALLAAAVSLFILAASILIDGARKNHFLLREKLEELSRTLHRMANQVGLVSPRATTTKTAMQEHLRATSKTLASVVHEINLYHILYFPSIGPAVFKIRDQILEYHKLIRAFDKKLLDDPTDDSKIGGKIWDELEEMTSTAQEMEISLFETNRHLIEYLASNYLELTKAPSSIAKEKWQIYSPALAPLCMLMIVFLGLLALGILTFLQNQ